MAVIEVTKDNFEKEVLESDKKVLVDFNAQWCAPCRMLKPVIDEMGNNSEYKVVSINIDDEESLAVEYGVMSIPCLVVFDNGKEVNRSVGLIPKSEIIKLMEDK